MVKSDFLSIGKSKKYDTISS